MAGLYFAVGADFQKLQRLKKDLDDLKSKLKGMDSAADKKAFDALNRKLQQTQKEYDVLAGKLSRYNAEQNKAARATDNASDSLLNYIKKGAALAGITFGVDKIKDLGSEIINVRNQFQQLEIAFGTMLKSTDKAATLMKGLTRFAAETPFGLQSAASGAKQLLAYGSTADTVIKELTMLGDVAAGTGQQIGDLVYLYGTLRTQGRAYLMDIRQFAGRGIPIYDELAKVLNTSKDKVNEFVSAGKVGFKEVELAFKNMTAQGGLYGGLMEEQSKSIGGRMEALKDNIDSIFNQIGKDSEGFIYKSIDGINTLVENYETVGKVLLELVAIYGSYRTALMLTAVLQNAGNIRAYAFAFIETARSLGIATAAQTAFNTSIKANPYALAAAGIVALGYGIYKLATYETEAEKAQNRLNDAMRESEKNALSEQRELAKLKGELSATTKGTDEYKKVKDEIVNKYGQYYAGLEGEIERVGFLDTTYQKLTKSIQDSFAARQYTKFAQSESDNLDEILSENLGKIQERLLDDLGDEIGTKYYTTIRNALLQGQELSSDAIETLNKVQDKGTIMADSRLDSYINNIREAQKITDEIDKKARIKFGIEDTLKDDGNAVDDTTSKFISLSEQIDNSKKKVSDLKKELSDLQKGVKPSSVKEGEQFDFAKGIEEKTKSLKEEEDKLSYLLYGKSSSGQSKADKSGESAAEKARKQAQEVSDQNERISQLLDKQGLERRRQNEDLANQEAQAYINSISNAAERIRKQRDHDNKLEIQALERQKEDYIRKIIENEREKFEAQEELNLKQDKKYVKKVFDPSSVKVDTSQYDNILGFNIAAKVNEEIDAANKAWNDYFIEFGTYQEKRKAIIEKYNQEIAQATQDGDKAALENKKQNALDELDNSVKNSAKLMAQLFADSSLKSVGEIQKIIDKAEMLMNYLAAVKDEQGNATIDGKTVSKKDILNLGISESELKKLELSAQEVEALRNAINKLKGDLGGKSPFKQFESQVKDAYDLIKKGGKENIGQGISGIGGAIQGITPELKEFGNSMGQIFGEQTGDDINTIVDLLGNTAQVGQGVGKIMAGDVVGGIKDVVTGIGNIFAMGSEADKRHREALKVINESVKAQEHAYQLALRLKSLEYEKGDTIFGDDPYGKAIHAAEEYKDAIEVLKKSLKGDGKLKQSGLFGLFNKVPKTSDYAALQNIDIVTGHKKTGLFGWGKGKDTYTGILTVYPELIDGQGKFNAELAKTILAERKMSEESKATVQQMIDNAEAVEEAYAVMKDYLTDIFGDLGNSMTDALVNAFQKGEDAADAFYDSASGMLQNLVKDMINSAVIGPVIQKATEDAMKVMEDTSLTNEQRMDKLMQIVDNALEQGLAASDTAKDLYDYANKTWENKTGEKLFDNGSSQQASRGGFETMSQDTASALEGRFTAMQMSLITIDENVARIAQWNQPIGDKFNFDSMAMPLGSLSQSSLRIERMIEENKSIAIHSYYELRDINKNTKELYQIREDIASFKKDGIKIK